MSLSEFKDVHAKTGTAEFVAEDGSTQANSWNVGYRGDMAYAMLVVGGADDSPGTGLAYKFLKSIPE